MNEWMYEWMNKLISKYINKTILHKTIKPTSSSILLKVFDKQMYNSFKQNIKLYQPKAKFKGIVM